MSKIVEMFDEIKKNAIEARKMSDRLTKISNEGLDSLEYITSFIEILKRDRPDIIESNEFDLDSVEKLINFAVEQNKNTNYSASVYRMAINHIIEGIQLVEIIEGEELTNDTDANNSKLHDIIREIEKLKVRLENYKIFMKENHKDEIINMEKELSDLYCEAGKLVSIGAVDNNPLTTKEKVRILNYTILKDKELRRNMIIEQTNIIDYTNLLDLDFDQENKYLGGEKINR